MVLDFTLLVIGALGIELARLGGTWLLEYANPGIRALKKSFPKLDLAMRLAAPDVRSEIANNPVTPFAMEILELEGKDLSQAQVKTALAWVNKRFDFLKLATFNPESASPEQRTAAQAIADRVARRFESSSPSDNLA